MARHFYFLILLVGLAGLLMAGCGASGGKAGTDSSDGGDGNTAADGADGNTAADGADGTSAQDGTDGTDGTNGASGTDGTDGASGTSAQDGTDGASAQDGTDGTDAVDGTSAADGTNGVDGLDDPCTAVCNPGWQCGPDGCGGTCGEGCAANEQCNTQKHMCESPAQPPGDDSFDQAKDLLFLEQGVQPAADSLSPTGDKDYYKFTGVTGQAIMVVLKAQEVAFDKNTIDTVLTLYDANQQELAINDDPFPRTTNDSTIVTILPAKGTYYLKVEECWDFLDHPSVPPGAACADPQTKSATAYTITLLNLDPAIAGVEGDPEKGNTAADAQGLTYGKNSQGNYFSNVIYGTFATSTDIDVFSFTLPADIPVDAQDRSVGFFDFHPSGLLGTGSTSDVGSSWITTAAEPMAKIALTDAQGGADMGPPLELDVEHLLWISHPGGALGQNDFYVINHRGGSSNPLETDDAANNTIAGAQLLAPVTDGDVIRYFIEGDITDPATDSDHFSFAIPDVVTNQYKLYVFCGAERSGSGLRQFQVELLTPDGNAVLGGKANESKTVDASITELAMPADKSVILKISAGSQASDVSSTFYRCGVALVPPG